MLRTVESSFKIRPGVMGRGLLTVRLTVQLRMGLGERACLQTMGPQLGVESQPGVPERGGARRGPGPICHFYERRENKLERIHLFSPRQSFPWNGQGGAASK